MTPLRKTGWLLTAGALLTFFILGRGTAQETKTFEWKDSYSLDASGVPRETKPEPETESPSSGEEVFPWPLPSDAFEKSAPDKDITESTIIEEPFAAPEPPQPQPQPPAQPFRPESPPAFEKRMVEVPPLEETPFLDAGDFRDPFFPVRGFQENSPKVLEPGVTVDGLRFYSYADSGHFVENFYRNSNFSMEDVFGRVVQLEKKASGCLNCHGGIEEISPNHRFRCTKCHSGNRRAKTMQSAHKGMVPNPSDLNHAPKFCGKCHADQIEKVKRNPMSTAAGIINTTRYAWGAQPYGKNHHSLIPDAKANEKPLPSVKKGHAVDKFLRTKCLRCHIQGEAPHRPGDYRATGCAACHMVYANDGTSLTRDPTIQSKQRKNAKKQGSVFSSDKAARPLDSPRGYPVIHKFTLAIPSVQCEHCHNNNGVGNEFEGLFKNPARPKPAREKIDATQPVLYGSEHEFLVPDIHRERGMHCIDCHGSEDIKGAPLFADRHSRVQTRCEDCHGTHKSAPEEFLLLKSDPNSKPIFERLKRNPNLVKKVRSGDSILVNAQGVKLPHIKRDKNQWVLFSKVTGKKHPIPILKEIKAPPAHQIAKHMKSVECHACHARWSASDWGLHLIEEPSPDVSRWKDWNFSDPSLRQILSTRETQEAPVSMLDWTTARSQPGKIEGQSIPGVLWDILTESSWGTMILGKNHRGKYSILKPRYQYFFTERAAPKATPSQRARVFRTTDGKPGMALLPHTPHTIRKTVRSCESCHENQVATGLGDPGKRSIFDAKNFLIGLKTENRVPAEFQLKQLVTQNGVPLQAPVPPKSTRFLNQKELVSLQEKSNTYRVFRYFNLRQMQLPRLLTRSEFPYDVTHKRNEALFGSPPPVEDMFYHLDQDEFLQSPKRRAPALPSARRYEGLSPFDTIKPPQPEPVPSPTVQRFDTFTPSVDPAPRNDFHQSEEPPPLMPIPEQAPPADQTLEEEGNSIIDFFQDMFEEGAPPSQDFEPIPDPTVE